ncbi:hypothetical protein STENM223S_09584 [Streptomyces tendae]
MALELRHPALVEYLGTVFERLWRLAIPLTVPLPDTGIEGISHREQSIAALRGGPPGRGDRGTPRHQRPPHLPSIAASPRRWGR